MTRFETLAARNSLPAMIAFLLILALLGPAPAAGQEPEPFNALMLPELSQIEVGDTAFVNFEVDSTAHEFNGYEVTIQWDPARVSLLEVTEGELMTGACGNTFFVTTDQTDSTITIAHVILCGGVSLDGPGVLTTYAFEGVADGLSPVRIASDPDHTFAFAGIWINPDHPTFPRQVIFHDAAIQVGAVGAVAPAAPRGGRSLRLEQNAPNPFNPQTEIVFELGAAGPARLEIIDARGRLRWQQEWPRAAAGLHRVAWRGVAGDGAPLPSGVYFYRLRTASAAVTRKLTLVR